MSTSAPWSAKGNWLIDEQLVPEWLAPAARFAAQADVASITRFAPPENSGKHSAVLIALRNAKSGPEVVLVERATGGGPHSGQPAFPGGVVEEHDADAVAAALRETWEEAGITREELLPVARLPELWIPVSDYVVTPVVAWWQGRTTANVADPREIAAVHSVSIAELVLAENRCRVQHPSGYVGPAFDVRGMLVWGFTAGILDALIRGAGWARAWDEQAPPRALVG
ncbi:MAG: hypothetical protein RJB01_1173 [Actinomycetota bacterium]|jgi:8-oxo-dGTP pyrophosphatase MutT (NUDIX family)